MVKPTEYVQNFPAKVYAHLTPSGSKVSSHYLRLDTSSNRRDKIDGETAQGVFYEGFNLRFGYDTDERDFWVAIEPTPGERELGQSSLAGLLQVPERVSTAKPRKREEYQVLVTKGRIFRKATGAPLSVRFRLLKENADDEKVFDAFWYAFKPIIAAICEEASNPSI
jgi:hypothetical protein